MAFLEVHMVQVREIIRRWQAGENKTAIGQASGVSARTVGRYLKAATALGVEQGGEGPPEEVIAQLLRRNHPGPLPQAERAVGGQLRGHEEQIARWLKDDRLQLTRVQELLKREGVGVSYTSLRRYVRDSGLRQAKTTLRMPDWPPGEVAEMDFGKLGSIVDGASGKRLVIWALVVVLPFSRHCFVWPLRSQTLAECIAGLETAWRFFGGVPKRLILDNFPAAVAGADPLNPRPTRGFLEYSQTRGFLPDPARVRRPQDKPHVERNIQYVRERFFKGGTFDDFEDCRIQAAHWCLEVAGLRVHGTTRLLPRHVFETEEQALLLPYDGILYDVPEWKDVTVHPDHHVSFSQALYSAPSATCPPGTKLEVRGDQQLVKLYHQGALMKAHPRQPRGGRSTDPADYPKEKSAYAMRHPDAIVRQAAKLGPSVECFAQRLFDGPIPWRSLRSGQKLLSLGRKYGPERLDAACERALAYDLADVARLEKILIQALEGEPRLPLQAPLPLGSRFARPPASFDHNHQAEAAG